MSNNPNFIGSRIENFKFEKLALSGGVYIHAGYYDEYFKEASISMDFTRDIIGSANFLIQDTSNINYYSDLIRPYYVCNYVEYPLCTFMLMSPDKNSDGKIITRSIQAYDLLLALDQDKINVSYKVASGTNVITAITTLLTSVGTWVNYNLEASTQTLPTDVCYEIGKSKLFIINSLLNMINYNPLWVNALGVFKATSWSEYSQPIWEFEDNEESLYKSGIDAKLDYTTMYNKVIILANQLTADTSPLIATRTFEDELMSSHPFSYTSIGRYITKLFQSDAVSQTYVDLRARRELLKALELQESINYKNAFVGLPEMNDCYTFKNTLLDLNARYKIVSLSWQLKFGTMVNTVIRRSTASGY